MEQETPLFGGIKFRYDVDKIKQIKRLVESVLETSFGEEISINEMVVLPTQKYDNTTEKWVPDSHTIFVSIQKNTTDFVDIREITNLVEGVLGFEVCVDFV
jgi:hypothetical protein